MSRLKKLPHAARHKAARITKSRYVQYVKKAHVWIPSLVVILAFIFVALPVFAAKAPGQAGYSIMRAEESVATTLMPIPSWRESLRLDFANDRVAEAVYVANQADQKTNSNQAKTAATINGLLGAYEDVYEKQTSVLNQKLTNNKKTPKSDLTDAQKATAGTYDELQLLRLQAPDGAQLAVLSAIDDTQQNLASLNDSLGNRPLSGADLSELARLIPIGIITSAEVDQLTSINSSRELHAQLVEMINNGQLPSDITYMLDQDLIKQVDSRKASVFAAVSEFEQMQRISAVIQASRPTSAQQKAIQAFVASYQPGQTVSADSTQPYITPIVYGIALSGRLLTDLSSLKTLPMSSDNQALLNSWKKVVDPPNLTDIYDRLMTGAASEPQLAMRNLIRMQQELVDGQKAQVSYLVMPPGWGTSQLGTLNTQMGIEIATKQFEASKPDANQELASLAATGAQLQTALDSVQTTHTATITKLQTQINNFTGTPDQLAQLKADLLTLDQNQKATINNLQTQLKNITIAHANLGDALTSLKQEQVSNLTQLELRAASNAQTLAASVKADLTTSLTAVQQSSQTLITGLQTQVDGLGTGQIQLREQLTADLQIVRSDYVSLIGQVQGQIDAGSAVSAGLTTDLQAVQASLTTHASQLTSLSSGAATLTTLVTSVQTTANTQATNLQTQVDALKIDQHTAKTAVDILKAQQISDVQQLTSQIAGLSVLQTEAQAVITTLSQQQAQATTAINNLTTNFDTLQTAFDASEAAQTALQAAIADQSSALGSLQSQTQSAIATLTTQQTQLTTQLNALAANTATLTQTLTAVQAASTATQTQLTALLASPPWAIPVGTYVTQSDFDTLSAQINTQFVAKSAALDAQFQTYQQTLNTSISQINSQVQSLNTTVTNTAATQATQQTTINTLTTQVQTLQTQVQALISASTPPGGL